MSTPVTVAVYPFRSDAEIASARLSADGIRSAVRVDDEGGLNPGFFNRFGVRIEVDSGDVEDACVSLGIERVTMRREVVEAMFAHAQWAYPAEACGLLAVDDNARIRMVFCLTNAGASQDRFVIDPEEHFGCVRYADNAGWQIGGVFHSHTTSQAYPSERDVNGGGDPAWLQVIVGPVVGQNPTARAFRFCGGTVSEASVIVEP